MMAAPPRAGRPCRRLSIPGLDSRGGSGARQRFRPDQGNTVRSWAGRQARRYRSLYRAAEPDDGIASGQAARMSRAARSPDSMAPSMPRAVHARCSPQRYSGPCGRPIPAANRLTSPGRNHAHPPRAKGSRPQARRAEELELAPRRGPDRLDRLAHHAPRLGLRQGVQPARVSPHHPGGEARDLRGVLAVPGCGHHARGPVREHARPIAVPLPENASGGRSRPASPAGTRGRGPHPPAGPQTEGRSRHRAARRKAASRRRAARSRRRRPRSGPRPRAGRTRSR